MNFVGKAYNKHATNARNIVGGGSETCGAGESIHGTDLNLKEIAGPLDESIGPALRLELRPT